MKIVLAYFDKYFGVSPRQTIRFYGQNSCKFTYSTKHRREAHTRKSGFFNSSSLPDGGISNDPTFLWKVEHLAFFIRQTIGESMITIAITVIFVCFGIELILDILEEWGGF